MAENMKWRKIQIDFVTNLPDNKGHDYKHCLTVVDLHTKWIEILPLKSKTASEVAYRVCALIRRYGCPERILCDRGIYILMIS